MDAAASAPRERGWGLVVLALLASLAVAAAPVWPGAAGLVAAFVRLVVPVEQTLLLVIPAVAACAVVAWWRGGSAWLAAVWLGFAGWTIAQPFAPGVANAAGGGYPHLVRGWTVVLASAFGLVAMAIPQRAFLGRALAALGLASAVAGTALLVTPNGPGRLVRLMTAEYGRRVESSLSGWHRATTRAAWTEATGAPRSSPTGRRRRPPGSASSRRRWRWWSRRSPHSNRSPPWRWPGHCFTG